ncbi:MAG: FliO/MopB family protein [Syntrophomonadaceae bacterium]|nr:FliO/MopB family protein [Syntrophomonadaceae bacterium]
MRQILRIYLFSFSLAVILGLLIWGGCGSIALAVPFDEGQPVNLPEYSEPAVQEAPGLGGLFFRIVLSLAVIVLLSYFLIRLISNRFKISTSEWVNVLDHLSLGPNRSIFLIDVAGKVLVLGITDHSMVKIMEIEDEMLIAEMRLNSTFNASRNSEKWLGGWSRFWPNWYHTEKEGFNPPAKSPSRFSFHRVMEEQLTRMRGKPEDDQDD